MLKLLGKVRGGPFLSEEGLLVGQHEHLANLRRLLGLPKGAYGGDGALFEPKFREVGIVGAGGIGKTALALRLYDDPDVREWFDGGICWLVVGPNPSEDLISGLQKQILWKFCRIDEDPGNPMVGRALIRRALLGKRVLICLDNVWKDTDKASPIVKADSLSSGSCILKTSRNRRAIDGEVYELNVLSRKDAWELFQWHAFEGARPPDNLVGLAEEAVDKCGGMPLAIRLLGKQLARADQARLLSLQNFLRYALGDCQAAVQSSYDSLPKDFSRLEDVFLLIAGVWPQIFISRERGRMVQNLSTAVYGLEDLAARQTLARGALEILLQLSLVSLKTFGRESHETDWLVEGLYAISVHDVVAEFARGRIKQKVVSAGRGLLKYIDAVEVPLSLEAGRHAYVRNSAALEQLVRVTPSSELLSLVMEVDSGVEGGPSKMSAMCGLEPAISCRLLIYRVQGGSNASGERMQELAIVEPSKEVSNPLVSMPTWASPSALLLVAQVHSIPRSQGPKVL